MTQTDSSSRTAATARIPLLDVARGVAILGTLATNVWVFATPGADLGFAAAPALPPVTLSDPGAAAELLFRFLANGKFLALLTVLFGVGVAIQHASAERRGRAWPGPYYRRAAVLAVEGTVHFALVFAFDVLTGYAFAGALLAWSLARSRHVQRRVTVLAVTFHLTVVAVTRSCSPPCPAPDYPAPDCPAVSTCQRRTWIRSAIGWPTRACASSWR